MEIIQKQQFSKGGKSSVKLYFKVSSADLSDESDIEKVKQNSPQKGVRSSSSNVSLVGEGSKKE